MNLQNKELRGFLRNVFRDMDIMTSKALVVNYSNDELYGRFMKQMSVFYQAFGPMHRSDLEMFFTSADIIWDNLDSLLNSHFAKILKEFTNAFLILMYAYSFAFSLIEFCRRRTGHGYFKIVSKFMKDEFIVVIADQFYAGGGWKGLSKFCAAQKLLEVLDFINVCYSAKGKLLTFVQIKSVRTREQDRVDYKGGFLDFGIHSERTLNLLKNNLEDFERSVFLTYGEEISRYPYFTRMLTISFLKMNLALDHIARYLNPPDAARRILTCPLLDFFEETILDSE